MAIELDHTILEVSDLDAAVAFYRDVVGLQHAGSAGPFELMMITDDTGIDLQGSDTPVSRHLAFSLDRAEFDAAFTRIKAAGITYGDGPSRPTNQMGPGRSTGVHGRTWSVYFHDPSGNLLEILTYDDPP